MAQAMIMRRGGAGLRLPLSIYASVLTLPASAVDGAVAVVSATAIGNVTMDKATPATAAEGDLWLNTAAVGSVAIPLSSKPLLYGYPSTAMQYIGGAWVAVRAFVYHSAWHELRTWLYENGDAHTENGGAWSTESPAYGTVTYGATYITSASSVTTFANTVTKQNNIDITPYSQLKALIQKTTAATTGAVLLRLYDGTALVASGGNYANWLQNEERTLSLDVSEANGSYRVVLRFSEVATYRVKQVWLE